MPKPRYRLEALLRVKFREKQRAEIALAKAIIALKQAREKERQLLREKDEIVQEWHTMRDEMSREMGQGRLVFDGTVYVNYLRKLKEEEVAKEEEIEAQRQEIQRCEERVARRRRDYIDAAREHQVMEKHKDLWQKRLQAELSRKEEKEFDELANTIHQLRKWRGEGATEEGALAH